MKQYKWNDDKNELLKKERNISFEETILAINENAILDIIDNPNYKNQRIYIININNYAYLVPFTEDNNEIFLKTIIPNRIATKKYINNK